jgi:hypothetical protein
MVPCLTESEEDTGAFIRKYDSDGNVQWTDQFSLLEGIAASGVSVDSSAGVFVGGIQIDPAELFIRKYNIDGNEQWTRLFDTASSG